MWLLDPAGRHGFGGSLLQRCLACKLFLVRPEWSAGHEITHPWLGIGLEWPQKTTSFENAYTGIWVNRIFDPCLFADLVFPAISRRLESALRTVGGLAAEGYKLRPTGWWPLRRPEKPREPEFLLNLDGYADALVTSISALWVAVQALVHESFVECAPGKPALTRVSAPGALSDAALLLVGERSDG